jgi:hypothetical protein
MIAKLNRFWIWLNSLEMPENKPYYKMRQERQAEIRALQLALIPTDQDILNAKQRAYMKEGHW